MIHIVPGKLIEHFLSQSPDTMFCTTTDRRMAQFLKSLTTPRVLRVLLGHWQQRFILATPKITDGKAFYSSTPSPLVQVIASKARPFHAEVHLLFCTTSTPHIPFPTVSHLFDLISTFFHVSSFHGFSCYFHGCPSLPPQCQFFLFWKLQPNDCIELPGNTWSRTYQAIKGWISFLPSFHVPRFSPVASQLVAFHGDFLDVWFIKLAGSGRNCHRMLGI